MLTIEAIRFNHDPNSATHDALNIRVDNAHFVNVPEWRHGVSVHPADSPAAYAIAAVGHNTITIQARFHVNLAVKPPLEIRAVTVSKGNPLGNVLPAGVVFDVNGNSGWVTFKVSGHLGSSVRVTNIAWRWEAKDPATNQWVPFATTLHRIYVILDIPTAPWQQTPYAAGNTQLPWTSVLDFACWWASGASTKDAAAGLVTEHIYALGPGTVTYDCPGGGASHYSAGNFNCTAFLDRLHGGPGNGIYVNCSDCATFTATFSNILGCDLWESRMSKGGLGIGGGFALNPLLAIGSSVWQTACGWGSFSYHEVAWKGGCTANDDIFDACLEVNGSANPTTGPPFIGVLPKNMLFGPVGTLDYRGRLCPPAGQPNCNPQPPSRQRRMVV